MSEACALLLAEDNRDDEELALGALTAAGVADEVVVVRDGVQALAWLFPDGNAPRSSLPRVIVLDIKLPRVDGFEVLRRLRAHPLTKSVPVVMMSSSDAERDVLEALRLGANSYVQKPVDFEEFEETVRTLAVYWLRINRTAMGRGGDT